MTDVAAAAGVADALTRVHQIRARFDAPVRSASPSTAAASGPSATSPSTGVSFGSAAPAPGSDFASVLLAATGRTALAPAQSGVVGDGLVDASMNYLGVPYLWGGTDPAVGLDCSGFVQRVHRDMGIETPRVSRDQARGGQPVASLADARPGDVLAFGEPVNHVALYLGDGQMIHAPRRGDVVKAEPIDRPITAIRRYAPVAAPSTTAAAYLRTASPAPAVGDVPFAELFAAAGARHGIDPRILSAVAKVESNYDPTAVSHAGARGLMQFMPATAAGMGIDPLDPAQAVDGAARYLTTQLRDFGSLELALAAYNAGPGAVRRHGGVPPYAETQNYVSKVIGLLNGGS